MPKFRLNVVDTHGNRRAVVVTANSEQEAISGLRERGLDIAPVEQPKPKHPEIQATSTLPPAPREFVYKMVQIAPRVTVQEDSPINQQAAEYLERIVDLWAVQGWEFYRVDSLAVRVMPGCLGVLFGVRPQDIHYSVVTFRRRAQ